MKTSRTLLIGGALTLSLLVVSSLAVAQPKTKKAAPKRESAILYGSDFSYSVEAPVGWVLDDQAGKSQDLSVVFYKRGQSWAKGDAVIYININAPLKGKSLEKFAQDDKADFLKSDAGLIIKPAPTLKTADGRRALTQTFLHSNGKPPFEESAYVQMPTITQTIVLTATNRAAFDKAQADFAAIIGSLSFLTKDIRIEKSHAKQ